MQYTYIHTYIHVRAEDDELILFDVCNECMKGDDSRLYVNGNLLQQRKWSSKQATQSKIYSTQIKSENVPNFTFNLIHF